MLFLPGELRDAVKSGDYMAVKLALNSKEDYNLDQEVRSFPFQIITSFNTLFNAVQTNHPLFAADSSYIVFIWTSVSLYSFFESTFSNFNAHTLVVPRLYVWGACTVWYE